MNKQETAEAILVMQAWINGDIVEEKDRDPDGVQGWHEYEGPHTPLFNFERYEYRIKPSPREWEIIPSRLALATRRPDEQNCDFIKVREVLNED